MGCTTITMIQSRKVVPLPPQTTNSYIDKFPAIIILKIKQKFDALSDKQSKDLSMANFQKLYSITKINQEVLRRLFNYFNDNQKSNIKFRQFIVKYATIVKCQESVFFNIVFEMYKNNPDQDFMTQEEFGQFVKNETAHLSKYASLPVFPLNLQKFSDFLLLAKFKVDKYQQELVITTEDDVPFKIINQELHNCDFNDFVPGNDYYILSNAWFYRWSFYYQDTDHTFERHQIISTKILPQSTFGKRKSKRKDSGAFMHNDSLRISEIGNTLVEQPKIIDFDDIEGQYRGQLKENLKISTQIKVISQNLWKLLCSLYPSQLNFKRKAINIETLEYYPKAIYYAQTNEKGSILVESQEIKFKSQSQLVYSLKQNIQGESVGIFTKNLDQNQWKQIQSDLSFAEISFQPRYFIVVTRNRQKFLSKAVRKEVTRQNLQLGDRVYANYAHVNQSEAYIIGIGENDTFKVHFNGSSYRYEIFLKRQELSIAQEELNLSPKRKNQSIIKGLPNVGNTCFMNSIIQCLIATPVLENFLVDYPFDQKSEPIGYGLSQIAKSLLRNEKALPQQFKKIIDLHMPLFSGFDQHDAQQFLNVLLDKLNQQIKQKPTVIDYLFGGKIQSKLTCTTCTTLKYVQQKMYILSLPIPQAQFNYYNIILIPVTSRSVKKLVFKLHNSALVVWLLIPQSDYCNAFEERVGMTRKDFLFVETSFNSLKKVKQEIVNPNFQKKLITQIGIVPSISLLAFQKLSFEFYLDLLKKKKGTSFLDFQPKPQAAWTVCKIIDSKNDKDKDSILVEYISHENDLQTAKIDKNIFDQMSDKLGSKSQIFYKKLILRRFNSSLKRLEPFGFQQLVGVPKWTSYNDLIQIVQRHLENLKQQGKSLNNSQQSDKDYIIRFLDPTKNRCIFCQAEIQMFNIEKKQVCNCCQVIDLTSPINWTAKLKNFWVYVDWINFSKCNFSFCTSIEIDPISKSIQNSRQDAHINLDSCMKLHSKPEVVEMECDKCKEKYQNLEHLIGIMPNILVVHMKQFRYTSEGHLIKLDVRLKWQEFLDSSKYTVTSNGKLYELYALVKHSGNSQSGHYTCMAKRKHPYEGKKVWVNFDDDTTVITKHEQKFIDDAYLLFYKKVDMPTSSLVIYSDLNHP